MTGFDFGMTAGVSQNTTLKQFEGNEIYDVTFNGCEARDINGVQDPSKVFKVLDIKFSNKDGVFTDTVWEPRESDYEDRESQYGPNPSNVKAMMLKFKHLIDTVNPTLAAKIDAGEQSIKAPDWNTLRQIMVKATEPGVGKQTKIKLIKNNKGEATFPSFFANYNKSGVPYMNTNFIGDNIYWTHKELTKIQNAAAAKPTSTDALEMTSTSTSQPTTESNPSVDIDFSF